MRKKIPKHMSDFIIEYLYKNYIDPFNNPITHINITVDHNGSIEFTLVGFDSDIWKLHQKQKFGGLSDAY